MATRKIKIIETIVISKIIEVDDDENLNPDYLDNLEYEFAMDSGLEIPLFCEMADEFKVDRKFTIKQINPSILLR